VDAEGAAGVATGFGASGLAKEKEGAVEAAGLGCSVLLLAGGAGNDNLGTVDEGAAEDPGKEKEGGARVGFVAVLPCSSGGFVNVIEGNVGALALASCSFLSSSFFLLASLIRMIAFASKSCFSKREYCL